LVNLINPMLGCNEVLALQAISSRRNRARERAMTFPDPFSDHADRNEAYRPTYPERLFTHLVPLARAHDLHLGLRHRQRTCSRGGDALLRSRRRHRRQPPADCPGAPPPEGHVSCRPRRADASVDLVTVALALHWFDLDRFYEEVRRVVRPGGVLACWTYHLQTVSPEVDAVVRRLYADILGPFWSPQIRHIEDGYRSLPFPFEGINPLGFRLVQKWDVNRLVVYMRTWSAFQRFRNQTGRDALDMIRDELTVAWGDPEHEREVAWDLHLRVGRVGVR
jgi:SAM-dependent methyltransferase